MSPLSFPSSLMILLHESPGLSMNLDQLPYLTQMHSTHSSYVSAPPLVHSSITSVPLIWSQSVMEGPWGTTRCCPRTSALLSWWEGFPHLSKLATTIKTVLSSLKNNMLWNNSLIKYTVALCKYCFYFICIDKEGSGGDYAWETCVYRLNKIQNECSTHHPLKTFDFACMKIKTRQDYFE